MSPTSNRYRKRRHPLEIGDDVIVPGHPDGIVGRITSEPNWSGKVRVDWESSRKGNQWATLDTDITGQAWSFFGLEDLHCPPELPEALISLTA